MKEVFNNTAITLEQGDITTHAADAIVNAANSSLMGGGGVDGAIHRAGGPAILDDCKLFRRRQGPLLPGGAVATVAGHLKAKQVIHTVGPIWRGGDGEEPATLRRCYRNSLAIAIEMGHRTIAFPSISTGVYGYPIAAAAHIAIDTVVSFLVDHANLLERVTWVLFDDKTFEAYRTALASIRSQSQD